MMPILKNAGWMSAVSALVGWGLLVAHAPAGPLDRSRVDPKATWLLHVDMECLRESPVGCGVLAERGSFAGSMFNDLRTDLNLDPGSDINAITVYGLPVESGAEEVESVVLISTTAAADTLPTFMKDAHAETFVECRASSPEVFSWLVDENRWYLCVKQAPASAERVVVMSRSQARVSAAMRLLDTAHAANFSETAPAETRPWPFDQDPAKGSMVFLVANRAMWGGRGASSPALKGTRGIAVDLREQHDESGVRWTQVCAKVRMENEQSAEQMANIMKGAVAWLSLTAAETDAPAEHCCKALDEASPKRAGVDVTLDLKVNSRELAAILDGVRTMHSPSAPSPTEKHEKHPTGTENRDTKQAPPAKNPLSSTSPRR
ncbi:MAG TPA: hypothetical protein VHN77_06330 [Phycisphaerales bacterium]|nr:hypothetical protein [Phycisphaerales bacterium]